MTRSVYAFALVKQIKCSNNRIHCRQCSRGDGNLYINLLKLIPNKSIVI